MFWMGPKPPITPPAPRTIPSWLSAVGPTRFSEAAARQIAAVPASADGNIDQAQADTLTELDRAHAKHGGYQRHPDRPLERWAAILGEEYGEAIKEVVEVGQLFERDIRGAHVQGHLDNLYAELTQTAAMAVEMMAWLRWQGLVSE